ncbi:nucleotidyl transferase AbiEii/AbiGii toxin family protein [Patescibacteria group bacterium]|nr:nucleotidyl transferase AbiEii/AbiGii toxin family protein [Candidatus Falkowbacteria bacterium]MBU3905703.1 nucleotidyl transferase AbiEii/AbiGii toxin family protein [Patescibacteria group bacterium]MBU4014867.1 nucleotidyl transferase AbiEii/AbiGii toxin family protein [Patescibacteria group bacterium]MBU4026477.1 nucleotidyl transferase AbiEii/AbiGii toxin family protein [Patescibacteria group bacterium]MBU4072620.1 nucleotidyl transferase AbiEii/AbiGii toxin family protein [Patescibacte
MKTDKEKHKKIMLNILADISKDPELSVNLGFKGGTCCYFIYGLDRFSVDLDFDLLNMEAKDLVMKKMNELLKKYGTVKKEGGESRMKLKYSDDSSALKVDISSRDELNYLNSYEIKDIVSSVPLNILKKEDIFANKLVAVKDRFENKLANKIIANRDIYDINFFFNKNWGINYEIIALRRKKDAKSYLKELIEFIEKKVDNKRILDGIGALVSDEKREWVKNELKNEVIKQLAIQIKSME